MLREHAFSRFADLTISAAIRDREFLAEARDEHRRRKRRSSAAVDSQLKI
jgi:hypothetical protein